MMTVSNELSAALITVAVVLVFVALYANPAIKGAVLAWTVAP